MKSMKKGRALVVIVILISITSTRASNAQRSNGAERRWGEPSRRADGRDGIFRLTYGSVGTPRPTLFLQTQVPWPDASSAFGPHPSFLHGNNNSFCPLLGVRCRFGGNRHYGLAVAFTRRMRYATPLSKHRSLPPAGTGIRAFGSPGWPGPWTFSCSPPHRYAHPWASGTNSAPSTSR